MILEKLKEELARLDEADGLLRDILSECAGYGYEIPNMSKATLARVQRFMNFDDSE